MGYSGSPPYWVVLLEAAGWDPLRAMEIENACSATWWHRYKCYKEETAPKKKGKLGYGKVKT